MEKVLVVVYSRTGHSLRLARRLCGRMQWPLGHIQDARPRRGALGTLRCLWDSLLRRCPPIDYLGPPPREFDLVVLVGPVWAARLAGPLRSFIARSAATLPDIAVISVVRSRGASDAVAEAQALASRTPRLACAFSPAEIDDGSCLPRLLGFAHALRRAGRAPRRPRPGPWRPGLEAATPLHGTHSP